ncbi:MAG TPA: glycosyltransferase family A protein [Bradyrhizobium sp.]|jgi:succinoglycan biosynthesis protein ExoM
MVEVTIAIPTFHRPKSLKWLLQAIAGLETDANVSVLVADNDADGREGLAICEAMKGTYRFPLTAIVVPERGIAQVRNALVDHARGDFIAMLDDDEWPERDWLTAFLRTQAETGADVLQGSILFGMTDKWAASFDGLTDIRRATGPIDMLQGAGNLLITRRALDQIAKPWFDPAFALTGGEDHDFFVRLKRTGVRFAWCDEAIARGEVAVTRTSLRWALTRAYGVGNSDMRVFLKYGPTLSERVREVARTAGALVLSPGLAAIHVFDVARRADDLRRLARAAGKTAALLGFHYNAYSVTHGE